MKELSRNKVYILYMLPGVVLLTIFLLGNLLFDSLPTILILTVGYIIVSIIQFMIANS